MTPWILPILSTVLLFSAAPLKAETTAAGTVPPEVQAKPFLYDLSRHLYRWYLDEIDLERVEENQSLVFLLRVRDVKLDPGDHSQYVEVIIPALKLDVTLKKADYRIDELNLAVRSRGFKITNVTRYGKDFETPGDCTSIPLNVKETKDYLFKTRHQATFPSPELYDRIRKAFRKEFNDLLQKRTVAEKGQEGRIIFVAPLSPVANEFWAFLEPDKLLVRGSSDIDLNNPTVWEHDALSFKVYDVLNQMVVSLDETAGDNSFMTRDQIGRALYNCIVLGERIIVGAPGAGNAAPPQPSEPHTAL